MGDNEIDFVTKHEGSGQAGLEPSPSATGRPEDRREWATGSSSEPVPCRTRRTRPRRERCPEGEGRASAQVEGERPKSAIYLDNIETSR